MSVPPLCRAEFPNISVMCMCGDACFSTVKNCSFWRDGLEIPSKTGAMGSDSIERAITTFETIFGGQPGFLTHAPGRVNLIGEHTDYNDGLVLPMAIERHVAIAGRPAKGTLIRLHSDAYGETAEIPVANPAGAEVPSWARYPQGVAIELARRGPLRACEGAIVSDLPIGSGLSSSAALEMASALAFEHIAGHMLTARERALLCRTAEVEFVGVPSGVMDQFASALSREGHALFIDCRSLDTHHIPLPQELVAAVCDTGVRRTLAASAYGERRQQCADAVTRLREIRGSIQSLRDLTQENLELIAELPDLYRRRARHVVSENHRVVQVAQVLESGEVSDLRDLFFASHLSLRDDFEVSTPELDAMVEAALASPGCVAARMTGAGFGGSAVALIARDYQPAFLQTVAFEYQRRTQREGAFFVTRAAAGAQTLELA
jgi:galactokinase